MIGLRVHELGHILPLLLRTPCRATCILPNPEAGNPTGYSLPNTRAKVLWRLFSLPRTGVQRGLDIPRKGLQSSLSATVSCRVKGICSFPKEGKKKSPEVVRGSPLPDRQPP